MSKAILKNYRQSSRKVRLVADLVRGKDVANALITLSFAPKRAAEVVKKVVESAVANAKTNGGLDPANLFVEKITVDEGVTIKRWRPRARGRSNKIRKRTSHIAVVLGVKGEKAVVTTTKLSRAAAKRLNAAKSESAKAETKGKVTKAKK